MMSVSILLVDDDPTWLAVLKQMLIGRGYKVATASSALQGLRLAIETQPELMLVDVVMPGTSGIELCRQLRDNPLLPPHLQVAMLSSMNDEVTVSQAQQAGARTFIAKSCSMAEIAAQVANLLPAP